MAESSIIKATENEVCNDDKIETKSMLRGTQVLPKDVCKVLVFLGCCTHCGGTIYVKYGDTKPIVSHPVLLGGSVNE